MTQAVEKMPENVRQIEGPVSRLPAQSESASVLGMIERVARDPSVDIAKMMQLMDWRKETIADQRRTAFEEAVAASKKEIPVVTKNATGHNNKRYADFAAYAATVDPIIGKHGLSYRFRTVQTEKAITVTCVLFGHGHSEETSLSGPVDATGGKNAIQAIGSTLTYLQRYSLVQMLGLAAGEDDDGRSSERSAPTAEVSPPGSITEEQAIYIREALEAKGASTSAFLQFATSKGVFPVGCKALIANIPADKYAWCVNAIAGFKKA